MSTSPITFDQFLRNIQARKEYPHCILLGAGASRNSGVQTAKECIDDWKKLIYVSNNLKKVNRESLATLSNVTIQDWLDKQGNYPPNGHNDEYSHYAEEALKDEDARKAYFEKLFRGKLPSPGYLILGQLIKKGLFKYIFTTNFDDLIVKAAFQASLTTIEVNLDAVANIFEQVNESNFIKIALHGDYKFTQLKNTAKELDAQKDEIAKALKYYLTTNDLVVIGYSGRDKSLINALLAAYKEDGRGCLFWISYDEVILPEVQQLICDINTLNNRRAYHVKTNNLDFDQVLGSLAKFCFMDSEELIDYLESIYTSNTTPELKLLVSNYQEQLESTTSIEVSTASEKQAEELQAVKLEITPKIEKTLRDLVFGFLFGGWNESNSNDKELIESIVKKDYQSWIESIREVFETPNTPIILKNGVWTVSNKSELLAFLSGKIYDNHLVALEDVATKVLGEINPEFDLQQDDRYATALYDKKLFFSENIREGIAETIVLVGIHKDKLVNCSTNSRNFVAIKIIRKLLLDTNWKLWGSLNSLLPLLSEAAPEEFLNCVENALYREDKTFDNLFKEESNGFGGRIYTTGLLWALENLAWSEEYLGRVCLILSELASIDPGGNWANRPINSLKTILLPWLPQTLAIKDKRISAVKPVIRNFPDIAWQVILAMLPSQHGTSSGSHKPKWRNPIPDNFKQEVLNEDYWDEVTQYANLAVDMAEKDIAKLIQLAKEFDHLTSPAFERLNALLASENVRNLPKEEKANIWKNLIEFTQKHRRYPDAAWVLPNDFLLKIEAITGQLAPTDLLLKYERFFGNNDWDLYDEEASVEKNWEVQRERLAEKRANAVAEIYEAGGIGSVVNFVNLVKTPNNVGIALAAIKNDNLAKQVIPIHIDDHDQKLKEFAKGFVIGAFAKDGWDWLGTQDIVDWHVNQKIEFILCLPLEEKTFKYLKEMLGADENLYWERAWINPYHTDADLNLVVDKLLEVKRTHAAIDVLYFKHQAGKGLDIERSIKALLAANDSADQANQISTYEISELIKALQQDPNTPEQDLINVEWFYVQLLDELHGNSPVLLQKKLATEPEFLAELMRLMYKPKNAGDEYPAADEAQKSLATNAWRLLKNWKLPPGLVGGKFDVEEFNQWVDTVKVQAAKDDRFEITMQEVGKVFKYYPEAEEGLWLPAQVAEVLDGKGAKDIRIGYALEIYNSRGVYTVDQEGKPELALSDKWSRRAEIAENEGFPRFGAKLREVADSYKREAQRNIDEYFDKK